MLIFDIFEALRFCIVYTDTEALQSRDELVTGPEVDFDVRAHREKLSCYVCLGFVCEGIGKHCLNIALQCFFPGHLRSKDAAPLLRVYKEPIDFNGSNGW